MLRPLHPPRRRFLALLLLVHLPLALSCTLTTPSSSPILLTLNNGQASHTLPLLLCAPLPLNLSAFTLSSSVPSLRPALSIHPLPVPPAARCRPLTARITLTAALASANLTLSLPPCALTLPVIAAGVTALSLPHRHRLTAPSAAALSLPAPRFSTTSAALAVSVVLPSGPTISFLPAASLVSVSVSPPPRGLLFVRLASPRHPLPAGNLVVSAPFDPSDAPRPALSFRLELHVPSTGAFASFVVRVAPLGPVVTAIRAPAKVLPNAGGALVHLVVSRAAADERRLVLLLPQDDGTYRRVVARETAYAREGEEYVSTVRLPALERAVVGDVEWVFEVIDDGRVTSAADDTGGFLFRFGWQPVLRTVFPQRVPWGSSGFMILVGRFSDSAKGIFFDGRRVDDNHILGISKSEITLRIPKAHTRKAEAIVSVAVKDISGLASNAISFSVDPTAFKVEPFILQSSFDKKSGRFLIPFLCNQRNAPTLFVSVDSIGSINELPTYSFSIRTSSMLPDASDLLASGHNNIVTISDRNLFQESDAVRDEMVTVFVDVTLGDRRGQSVLFISRQLRKDKVGTTVLPPPTGASQRNSEMILESRRIPHAECPILDDVRVETEWIINGKALHTPFADDDNQDASKGPVVLGFGNRLLLPYTRTVDFEHSIRFVSKRNGVLVADGYSKGQVRRQRGQRQINALLNGGMKLMSVPATAAFAVQALVIDDSIEPFDAESASYSWTCKESTSEYKDCPESLFPSTIRMGNTKVSTFAVSAPTSWEGRKLEYSLQVSVGDLQSEIAVLVVSFVDARSNSFPRAMLRTSSGIPSSGSSANGFTFQAYEDIILWISGAASDTKLDFALFHEGNGSNLIASNEKADLISHNGYWTRESRKGKFLGLSAHSLAPGSYVLQGALGEMNMGGLTEISSWMFVVAPSSRVVLSDPPVTDGFVGQTLFHAAALSVPSSSNKFFFYLRSVDRGDDKQIRSPPPISESCLGGCTGLPSETFTVPSAGRYVIAVEMYDPEGTRLIAKDEGSVDIRVHAVPSESNSPGENDDNVIARVQHSLQHMDEVTFLRSVRQLSTLRSVPHHVFSDAVEGLKTISETKVSNPMRVARVMEACTTIVRHEEVRDLNLLSRLRRVVQGCVDQSQRTSSSSAQMREAVANFYGATADKLSAISDGGDKFARSAGVSEALDQTRSAATRDILLVLSSGRVCGATGQILVPRAASDKNSIATVFDDYRLGVSCFNGQVMALSPEPTLSEYCNGTAAGMGSDNSDLTVFTAIERQEVTVQSRSIEILSGPTVYTGILRWRTEGEDSVLEESGRKDVCFRSRVSVLANEEVLDKHGALFKNESRVQCRGAGKAFVINSGAGAGFDVSEASTSHVENFELHADGRISAVVELKSPGATRMEVNSTLLRLCFQNSDLEGRQRAGVTASLVSILGAVIAFVAILCLVILYSTSCFDGSDSFSVPPSAAPRNSYATSIALTRSTRDDASTLNSEDDSFALNEWEAEYGSLSAVADRDIDSNSTVGCSSRDVRYHGTSEVDDFVSRGSLQGFRRQSLTDLPQMIPWMANSKSTLTDRNRQIDFLGGSSSSLEFFVPDVYGRTDPRFR